MKATISLVIVLFMLLFNVNAQNLLESFFKLAISAEVLFWTSDSQYLLMEETFSGNNSYERDWIIFDPQERSIRRIDGFEAQYTVNLAIDDVIKGEINLVNPDTLVLPSPDQHFVVMGADTKTSGWSTVLMDLTDNRIVDLGFEPLGIESGLRLFNTIWSDNSEAVVIASSALNASEPGFFHYVTGYADPQADLRVEYITHFDIGQISFATTDIYDVNQDGQKILLEVISRDALTSRLVPYPLVLWNATQAPETIDVFYQRREYRHLITAAFANDDPESILMVINEGLVRYSLLTGETEILNPDLNSTRFRQAKFSPNGEWLALIEDASQNNVYLFDVRTVLAPQDG